MNIVEALDLAAARDAAAGETCKDAADWLDEPDDPDRPLIADFIEKGETFALVGQSKAGKSFLALQMAVCIATGVPFLGRATARSRVYIANLEVSGRQYKKRLRRLVAGFGLAREHLRGWLSIDNLKGGSADWDTLRSTAKDLGAEVVFVDPFYQIFDGSESDDLACKDAVERMKDFHRDGLTLGVVFHAPKGFSGDRQLIDMISGSSILARFPESVVGLLNHANGEARIIDGVLRNYPPPEAATIRFRDGAFAVDADTPPVLASSRTARSGSGDRGAEATARQNAMRRDLLGIIEEASSPISIDDIERLMQRKGYGIQAIKVEIKSALAVSPPILERQAELDRDSATGRKKHGATFLMPPEKARLYRAQFERLAL